MVLLELDHSVRIKLWWNLFLSLHGRSSPIVSRHTTAACRTFNSVAKSHCHHSTFMLMHSTRHENSPKSHLLLTVSSHWFFGYEGCRVILAESNRYVHFFTRYMYMHNRRCIWKGISFTLLSSILTHPSANFAVMSTSHKESHSSYAYYLNLQ